jgi:hypothetical protein
VSALNSAGDTGTDTNVERDLFNTAVRIALSDVGWRGLQRETSLVPMLADKQWEYALPNDVLGDQIIDLRPQATDCRGWFEEYHLVPPTEFDRRKTYEKGIYTIIDRDLTRSLRIAADVEDLTQRVSTMEDTNWRTFDSDGVNDSDVKVDSSDYLEGNGSIRFQTDTTDSTDTAVGVQNGAVTAFDISRYLGRGHAFADARLTVADTGIHQITLRLGSDSSNYYQVSDSNQADCSAFQAGWNKIRFNFDAKTTTGTPADTAIDYAALFWSRDTTTTSLLHLNDTDWGFDNLVLKRGKPYRISYVSRFPWQDTGDGSQLLENSADDSDALMVQNDELELIMAKASELASQYLRDVEDAGYFANQYERLKSSYLMKNPSKADVLTSSYHDFETIGLAKRRVDGDS